MKKQIEKDKETKQNVKETSKHPTETATAMPQDALASGF